MRCRTLEGELTYVKQASTWTACQALLCGTDCQPLTCSGVVMADSIDFHSSMVATSTDTLCCSVKMSRLCQNLRQKGCQSGHVAEKGDLINDAAHGISGSCAVGQISLQRSQPVLNTAARISAPSLVSCSYKIHCAVRMLVCCPPDKVSSRSAQARVCWLSQLFGCS